MFSVRVSAQRTGRPTLAGQPRSSSSSGSAPILAPNPPPTSGAIDPHLRRRRGRRCRPARRARRGRAGCSTQWCRRPSRPRRRRGCGPRAGTAATRWLTMRLRDDDLAAVEAGRRSRPEGEVDDDVGAGARGRAAPRPARPPRGRRPPAAGRSRPAPARRRRRACVARLGDDGGDRLADEADEVAPRGAGGPSAALSHRIPATGAQVEVGGGEHADHAGRGLGLVDVDRGDRGVGHRRAHVGDVAPRRRARESCRSAT